MQKWLRRALASAGTLAVSVTIASAGTTVDLPYEEPGLAIVESLTGTGAFIVSALALVGGASTIAFSNNISDVTRWLCIVAIVIGLLVGVTSILATLYGTTGAEMVTAAGLAELSHLSTEVASQRPSVMVTP